MSMAAHVGWKAKKNNEPVVETAEDFQASMAQFFGQQIGAVRG
jgi:hypothetical protein